MTLPRYLDSFLFEEISTAEFSVALREPAGPDPEFDLRDEHGDAIGYLRIEGDALHLSGPYLEATGALGASGPVEFHDDRHLVLRITPSSVGAAVTVPDRRVAVRLAAGVAAALGQVRSN